MEKKKGLKRFKGFEGLEPFKVCTLRERISHVLSKKLARAREPNLFSEAERANCFVCAHFTASGILTCIFGYVQKKYLKGTIKVKETQCFTNDSNRKNQTI